ncbi:hypothetical protein, partial [Streptomyces sp. UNOC14_S4]|uniref:hypothetical protein n=1 Tax=Streptomyces sp. UNOC14_S4 TaxID=2872340 RepID=UPI001E530907
EQGGEQSPVEEFAAWLRQMRLLGGDLSVRELVRRTEASGERVARSTLQDALDAKRLPSIDHAVAMVRAMTRDEAAVDECRVRWRRARSAITGVPMPPLPAPTGVRRTLPPASAGPRRESAPAEPPLTTVDVPPPPPRSPVITQKGSPAWRWGSGKAVLLNAAVALAVVGGGVYALDVTDSTRGTAGSTGPTRGAAPGSTASASGPASDPLPPNLHIQAEEAGCDPVNHYDETPAQYKQNVRKNRRPVGPGTIDITNQTSSDEAVLLTGMHVRFRQRRPAPTTGITVADGQCGGAQTVRPFTTDLDRPSPVVVAEADPGGPGMPGHPPVTFPFKILPGDPEVFELTAHDTGYDCVIAVEIDWVAAGKAGKTILDNDGQGFGVLATPGAPAYRFDPLHSDELTPATYKDLVHDS